MNLLKDYKVITSSAWSIQQSLAGLVEVVEDINKPDTEPVIVEEYLA